MTDKQDTQGGSIGNRQLPLHRWPLITRKLTFGKVKTGYKVNPDNLRELLPDPEQIIYIEQAFDYLDAGSSLREVSEWLGQKIGKSIVHQTISNLYRRHRRPYLGGQKTKKNVGRKLTREEKAVIAKRNAVLIAEREVQKKKAELLASKNKLKPEDYDSPPVPKVPREASSTKVSSLPSLSTNVSFAFTPNEGPQTEFLESSESEILYGGAAGGEPKSWFNRLLS